METDEHVLEVLTEVEPHLKPLKAATQAGEIVRAADSYLASWSKDRIENLQRIDGGWGPFDYDRRPKPIHGVADIARISNVLIRQHLALEEAGIDPLPELLELELYFAIAKQVEENLSAVRPGLRTATSRRRGYRHWSDQAVSAA